MSESTERPWPTISPLKRWGPLVLVLAVLIGGTVVATAKGSDSGSGSTASAPSKKTSKGYADSPLLPVTYADAKKDGTVEDYDWGDRCDTERGTIEVPSVLAPPCVPVWDGDKAWKNQGGKTVTSNGGATAPGVSEDTITIVYYQFGPQDLRKQRHVVLQPNFLPRRHEVVPPHGAKSRIVPKQIGQFRSLLHQVARREPLDLALEIRDAQQIAQDLSGIVEAEGLIEVRGDEKVFQSCHISACINYNSQPDTCMQL